MVEKTDVMIFWNELDTEARKEITIMIAKHQDMSLETDATDFSKPFDELPEHWQNLINNYYEDVIAPQKNKQQIRFDGIIHEKMPSEYSCPRCGAPGKTIQDKRGIHWKCGNCGWDTERFYDMSKEGREFHINRCAQLLKDMFPEMNFVRNFSYSPDAILTGIFEEGITNYDLGVYYFGKKIQRLRVERNQHITYEQFMGTEHDIYVIGRKTIVEKLADKDGLVVHYLLDEPKKPIGMSRLKIIRATCPQKPDRFENIQYAIPKDKRALIVTFDKKEMERLLFQDYYKIHTRNMVFK